MNIEAEGDEATRKNHNIKTTQKQQRKTYAEALKKWLEKREGDKTSMSFISLHVSDKIKLDFCQAIIK